MEQIAINFKEEIKPVVVPLENPEPVKKRKVIKIKKYQVTPLVVADVPLVIPQPVEIPVPLEDPEPVKKRMVIKIKKNIAVPPLPAPGVYLTKAMEAFETIREYYTMIGKQIPECDIKWYQEELIREKKEYDEFWERCAETKVNIECVLRGDDDWDTAFAVNEARNKVKALPIQESDIGPMPNYGTREFWAWCHKRKKLKEQKDAAILAAGGKINVKKVKAVRL